MITRFDHLETGIENFCSTTLYSTNSSLYFIANKTRILITITFFKVKKFYKSCISHRNHGVSNIRVSDTGGILTSKALVRIHEHKNIILVSGLLI